MEDDEHKSHDQIKQMPLYQKGEEIIKLVDQMLRLAPENNEHLEETIRWMSESAFTLCVKVAGAEGGGLYSHRMECATIIRKAARELVTNLHSLAMFGYEHTQYFDLLRQAVEEYRQLFVEWVDTFDEWDYVIDRWGLFNPPGVGANDKDPDDDIPFDPNDFPDDV